MKAYLFSSCLLLLAACGDSNPEDRTLAFVAPHEGDEVYGVVLLRAQLTPATATSVTFYLDQVDAAHELGTVSGSGTDPFLLRWFTQDTGNGAHTVTAVADRQGGGAEVSITVDVANPTRAASIPVSAVKMTPGADAHPPLLEPAFAAIFEDCEPLPGPVNTAGAEDSPYVTADGNELYLFFTPDASVLPENQLTDGVTGIYRSLRTGDGWGEPERVYLSYSGSLAMDGCVTVYGDQLWFCTSRLGVERSIDIFVAQRDGDRWSGWASAGDRLNLEIGIGELHLADGGNSLYFHSEREGGQGGMDLWVTTFEGGEWGDPINLEALNTEYTDGYPWVSEDEQEIWFTHGPAAPEIWRSVKEAGAWQPPEKVVAPFAGEPTFDSDGNLIFTHHFWDDQSEAIIEADLYWCRRR